MIAGGTQTSIGTDKIVVVVGRINKEQDGSIIPMLPEHRFIVLRHNRETTQNTAVETTQNIVGRYAHLSNDTDDVYELFVHV